MKLTVKWVRGRTPFNPVYKLVHGQRIVAEVLRVGNALECGKDMYIGEYLITGGLSSEETRLCQSPETAMMLVNKTLGLQ